MLFTLYKLIHTYLNPYIFSTNIHSPSIFYSLSISTIITSSSSNCFFILSFLSSHNPHFFILLSYSSNVLLSLFDSVNLTLRISLPHFITSLILSYLLTLPSHSYLTILANTQILNHLLDSFLNDYNIYFPTYTNYSFLILIFKFHYIYNNWIIQNHSFTYPSIASNSKNATTTLISSLPYFKYGKSPILDVFFLFLLFYYHLALHSFTNAWATVSLSSCWETNPQTYADVITSQQPSEPITINLSVYSNYKCCIYGSEINPIFFPYKSPSDLVIAIPGPY